MLRERILMALDRGLRENRKVLMLTGIIMAIAGLGAALEGDGMGWFYFPGGLLVFKLAKDFR